MERKELIKRKDLHNMKLVGYKEMDIQGETGCALCVRGLKYVYIVSDGNIKAYLGSECVRHIAEENGTNTMEGIKNIPENKRKQIKRDKKKIEEEEIEIPW